MYVAATPMHEAREGLSGEPDYDRLYSQGDVLPERYFLKMLLRERRRAERCRAPLSMVIFYPGNSASQRVHSLLLLLNTLQEIRREIDIIGLVGEDAVAVLLVDTNEEGANGFLKRIARSDRLSDFSIVSGTYPDRVFDRFTVHNSDFFAYNHILFEDSHRFSARKIFIKRTFDLAVTITALLLFLPLMIGISLAIYLSCGRPIFFKQVRLGRHGKPFSFYKFRSMHRSADDQSHRAHVISLINGENKGNAWAKISSDPRITRVGRFIRATRLDELPQLLNVLKGDLSLVGPRAPLPYEVEHYQLWHLRRILDVKPGITGLWQVEGGNCSFDDMVRMDLRYIKNQSFFFDLRILLNTVRVIFQTGGEH